MNKTLLRLAIASLVLLYLAIGLLQLRQFQAMERVMERGDVNALWSFQQVSVEFHRLDLALYQHLNHAQDMPLDELQLRYDIFLSRMVSLQTGTPRTLMQDDETYQRALSAYADFADQGDALFALSESQPPSEPHMARLRERLLAMGPMIQDIVLGATAAASVVVDARNAEVQRQAVHTTWLTAFQGVLTVLLAVGLARQSRKRESAQARAIAAQTELVQTLQRSEEELAARVADRTADLAAANAALTDNEALLHEARSKAEDASRMKSDFLANMSHEIRTPLNAVIGMSHLVAGTELTPKQRDYIDKVQRSAQHLLGLINDILDLSKIEAGKLDIEAVDFDLHDVLDGVLGMLGEKCAAKGLELVLDVDPALPERLHGDPLRVGQVLINYANNAVKFTERGEIRVQVQRLAGQAPAGDGWRLEVSDTGIGLTPEQAARLFQPFEQADSSTTRKFGGTGLGLAICRHLAHLMGGEVGVQSEAGQGSCFWLELPLRPALSAAPAARGPAPADAQSALARLRGARVLLVDDNDLNQQVGAELLTRAGLVVDIADNGQAALDRLGQQTYDLVLMDMQMPVKDGLSATRRLREQPQWANLPVLAMTANAMAGDRERCLQAGMNDHIAKPIDPALLFRQLVRWMPAQHSGVGRVAPRPEGGPGDAADAPTAATAATDQTPLLNAEVSGLDTTAGLKRVLNRRDTYTSLLRKFATSQGDAAARALAALQQGDLAGAERLLHTLKGSAATVGAQPLADAAGALETALRNAPDAATSANPLATTLAPALQSLIGQNSAMASALLAALPPEVQVQAATHIDWPQAHALLARLEALLADDDADAVELFQSESATIKAALPQQHAAIERALNQYDLAQALGLLRQARASLPSDTH